MKQHRLYILVTLLTLLAAGQSAWAQATQEVGVAFSFSQNQTWYRYSITPSNLTSQQIISEPQSNNYVEFNSAKQNDQYTIGDSNIPLTMVLNGDVNFNNAGNFTVGKVTVEDVQKTPYVLSVDGGVLGFRPFADTYNGTIPAHKAYYVQ